MNAKESRLLFRFAILWCIAVTACATSPDQAQWIQVDVTTKDEVVAQYGEPDLVHVSAGEEIVTYRPTAPLPAAPAMEIPVVQPGPSGTVTTRLEPVHRGLDAGRLTRSPDLRPRKELRLRYDAHGFVREVLD